ncbi:MAG: chain length-determining protein [Methylophilaceae bacterium]|nr:chain length-determining protein [Methylophilaceae bacterium]
MDEVLTQLLTYIKGIWKYRWYSVVVVWVVAIAGWFIVYKLPDNYESSARIYVDTQSVLKPLLAGMALPPNVEQQVRIMSRTLISRPNVERVMRMVDLDIKAKTTADKEKLVTELMGDIRFGSAGQDNLFTISYVNADPAIAKGVVQSLLTIFVEGSLGDKKQDASSAIRFIDDQIKSYEAKLVAAETALKQFKQKNMSVMRGGDYVSQMGVAADSLNQAKLELKEAQQSRDALKNQIGDEPESNATEEPVAAPSPEIDPRVQSLNAELDSLRLKYTERHPDIIAMKRLIKQLEDRKKEEAKLVKPSADRGKNYSPMLQQLNVALAEAEARVASMKARVEEYTARYDYMRSMSNSVPEVEADLSQLNRDYQLNMSNYQKLLESRESARMSGDVSATTELMTFKIIDPPTVPHTPSGPNRARLFSLALLVALVSGVGVAFIMSQINPTFHSSFNLREITERPILGTVSMIWTDGEIVKRKGRLLAFFFSLLILLAIYAVLMLKMTRGMLSL